MNPKPFWLLNHLTVPVVISSPKRISAHRATITRQFQLRRCLWKKEPAGTFQQGTAANRMERIYTLFAVLQGSGLAVDGIRLIMRVREEQEAFLLCYSRPRFEATHLADGQARKGEKCVNR